MKEEVVVPGELVDVEHDVSDKYCSIACGSAFSEERLCERARRPGVAQRRPGLRDFEID